MQQILLNKGYYTRVDDEDYDALIVYSWHIFIAHRTIYVGRSGVINGRKSTITMHSQIMNLCNGLQVDHVDGSGLNNQRSNLRPCTHTENQRNKGKQSNNTTGYKGVYYTARLKKWYARVGSRKANGMIFGGHHITPELAARKYDELALQLYGEFARLNFP